MSVWIGVVAPAGTPQPIADRIHAVVQDMLKDPAALTAMAAAGLDVMAVSRAEFASFVEAEYVRWGKIVKDAGVEKE
jgi:tripartite-type tricarboxylate transporter receptor subunit TctC